MVFKFISTIHYVIMQISTMLMWIWHFAMKLFKHTLLTNLSTHVALLKHAGIILDIANYLLFHINPDFHPNPLAFIA